MRNRQGDVYIYIYIATKRITEKKRRNKLERSSRHNVKKKRENWTLRKRKDNRSD